MLYNKQFSDDLFLNPPMQYRGAPFWAWNTKLNTEIIKEQIGNFLEMGMGGFFIHVRVGLDTEYLGDEFLDYVKICVEEAKKRGLYSWLYDEDRWPSGYGGGQVTKKLENRSVFLVITPFNDYSHKPREKKFGANGSGNITGRGTFLTAYDVKLSSEGCLIDYRQCGRDEITSSEYHRWSVYLETSPDSPWFNNQAYVDSLNPEAIQTFIKETHEKYKRILKNDFGSNVPGIFTDEPQFVHKQTLPYANAEKELVLPFTVGFDEIYFEKTGDSFFEHLPELIWNLEGNKISRVRYYYHRLLLERFAESYSDQVGKWCKINGLIFTGHMMEEPTLFSQSHALGEVMRNLKEFTLPGIDMLCDQREYVTAKQAQSVAHQCAREGVMCEAYGVTNWDFDFRGHKLQGDWLAALGVTLRVHHLTWMSMAGESKRDFPASIGAQSPWYQKYNIIETYFARVNTALTQGKALVRIGVLHPIESYWVSMGPNQETSLTREKLETELKEITESLLFGLLDFDYISEALIPEIRDGIQVGVMRYDVIIVPEIITIRRTTLEFLKEFQRAGHKIIFLGKAPEYIETKQTNEIAELAKQCSQIQLNRTELLEALEEYRIVDLRYHMELHMKKPLHFKNWEGERTSNYIYQMRQDKNGLWLFLANGRKKEIFGEMVHKKLRLVLTGIYEVIQYDSMSGEKKIMCTTCDQGKTLVDLEAYTHDSFLFRLEAKKNRDTDTAMVANKIKIEKEIALWDKDLDITREESNVAVLDIAEFSLDGEAWQDKEEILRLDNKLRKRLCWPLRREAVAQPWTHTESRCYGHTLKLKYVFEILEGIPKIEIAFEHLEDMQLFVNGNKKEVSINGHYIDHAIKKGEVEGFKIGENELIIEMPYEIKVNLEAGYLLGDFGVRVNGIKVILETSQHTFSYGDNVNYGMPFYGGNLNYIQKLYLEKGCYEIEVSKYKGALIDLIVDDSLQGEIIFAPYRKKFYIAESKIHIINLKCYGTRINTFGSFHNCDETDIYFSPDAWRTEGENWSYEYQLKSVGILKAPVLRKLEEI